MQAWELERELGKAQDKLNDIKSYLVAMLDSTEEYPNWCKTEREMAQYILDIIQGCSDTPTEEKTE